MSIKGFTVLILVFVLRLQPSTCIEKTCNQVLKEHNRQQVGNIAICTKKLNYRSGLEKAKKSLCVLKCSMERQGLIQKDGSIRAEELQKFIEVKFPKSLQAYATRMFGPCFNAVPTASKLANPNDDTCKLYEPFIKCISKTYPQLCRNEPQSQQNSLRKPATG